MPSLPSCIQMFFTTNNASHSYSCSYRVCMHFTSTTYAYMFERSACLYLAGETIHRDPHAVYAYLPEFPDCPCCGLNDQINRKGWYTPGPRQVMDIGSCWFVWGRLFLCKRCKNDNKPHYFLSYHHHVLQKVGIPCFTFQKIIK
jgi:hypothetical protein